MDHAALWKFAEEHAGVFTRAEARAFGASDKRLRTFLGRGVIEEVLDGVFRIVGSPFGWHSRLYAATRWASPAAASHRAAASLWGLDGFAAAPVEITTERRVHQPELEMVIHHTPHFYGPLLRARAGVPITTVEQTIAQLGAVCPLGKVAQGMDDALRQRLTSLERLVEHLSLYSRKGRSGMGVMRLLLRERVDDGYTESRFERALLRLIESHGLPRPTKQHPVRIGRRNFRIDFAYVPQKIAIEALSYMHHSLRDDWENDQDRSNLLMLDGWRIMNITYRRLRSSPDSVVVQIKGALDAF